MAQNVWHSLLALLLIGLTATEAHAQLRPQARPAAPTISTDVAPEQNTAAPIFIEEWLLARPQPRPQNAATPAAPSPNRPEGAPVFGSETNLPLPRYVTLKSDEVNARRGPSLTHRVDWVFTREDLPVMIIAEYGHWRRIVDREGQGGWVHYALLSGNRSVIIDTPDMPLLAQPDVNAPLRARFEAGVIAELGECRPQWCRIRAAGLTGWAEKTHLWGVDEDEIRD